MLTAFRQDPADETLDHCADNALKGDREFILALKTIDGYMALEYDFEELGRDREILLAAFRQNPSVDMLNCYASIYKEDRAFILALATIHVCRDLWYANDELRANRDTVLLPVSHNVCALRFVDDEVNPSS